MLSDHYSSPLPTTPKSAMCGSIRNWPGYHPAHAPGRAYAAMQQTDELLSDYERARVNYERTWNVGPLKRAPLHTLELPPTFSQEIQARRTPLDASSALYKHPLQDAWMAERRLLLRRQSKGRQPARHGSTQRGQRAPTRVLGRPEAGSSSELRRIASVFGGASMHNLEAAPSTPSRPGSTQYAATAPRPLAPAISTLSLLADREGDSRPRPKAAGVGGSMRSSYSESLRMPPRVLAPVMTSEASSRRASSALRRRAELELKSIVLP